MATLGRIIGGGFFIAALVALSHVLPISSAEATEPPPTFISVCDKILGQHAGEGERLSCFQAEATLQGAETSDRGARYAGNETFFAACIALAGSLGLALAALFQTRYAARIAKSDRIERYKNAFSAEISAVLAFLREVDVVGTLEQSAAEKTRKPFHPGEPSDWLRVYYANPDCVGLFGRETSCDLVWFYARMFSQFGRLIYLHRLGADGEGRVGMPRINEIQVEIARTIKDLDKRGRRLVEQLAGPMKDAPNAAEDSVQKAH